MAASDAYDGDRLPIRTTSYSYDSGSLAPHATTWTLYDAFGRAVAHGTGEPPGADSSADPPDDEPHVVG